MNMVTHRELGVCDATRQALSAQSVLQKCQLWPPPPTGLDGPVRGRGEETQDVHCAQAESGAVRGVIAGDAAVDPTNMREPHGRPARPQAG